MDQGKIPHHFYGTDKHEKDPYIRRRYEKYTQLLNPCIKPGMKILDVGGYRGQLLQYLPEGVDYWVADFDLAALEEVKQRGGKAKFVDLHQAKLPFADQSFDVLACTEVLEHLLDPKALMTEFQRILKRDGVVLISLPNECSLYHRLIALLGLGIDMYAFELYKHLHLPTIKQSEQFVSNYFKIIDRDYYVIPSCRGSRLEKLGLLLCLLPDASWELLAKIFPSFIARGVIFLGKQNL